MYIFVLRDTSNSSYQLNLCYHTSHTIAIKSRSSRARWSCAGAHCRHLRRSEAARTSCARRCSCRSPHRARAAARARGTQPVRSSRGSVMLPLVLVAAVSGYNELQATEDRLQIPRRASIRSVAARHNSNRSSCLRSHCKIVQENVSQAILTQPAPPSTKSSIAESLVPICGG